MIQCLDHTEHIKWHHQCTCLVDQRGHFHPHYIPQTIPQYLTIACLALSLLLFRPDQRISTAIEVDMDEMGNAQYQILTLKVDDPTKSSVSLIIPTQPTPIVSFTPAMPSSLQFAPIHSLVGPSQVQTKPPTVQPPSSPSTVTLFVNNQKTTANSRITSPLVSGRDLSVTFHSGTTEQGQYYGCVRDFETGDWVLCIDASCAIVEESEATPKTYGTLTPQQLAREKKDAHPTTRSSDNSNDPFKSCAYRLIYRRVKTELVTKDELTAVKRDSE
ncbi:hypothetical protein BLNAU_21047 [Blattamonas nauphoetae]|uniref:Uncharacterized protein n=1 Tax=Blattamonas nauphoetae TaxID=2049346 RepID=A0ABQ9WX20_9EUKA|nr:hypothetical protein BLNAU_21047 [Blattamonas nauphoetae]